MFRSGSSKHRTSADHDVDCPTILGISATLAPATLEDGRRKRRSGATEIRNGEAANEIACCVAREPCICSVLVLHFAHIDVCSACMLHPVSLVATNT